jgi:hypothetical protein
MAKLKETAMKELFAELMAAMPDENNFNNVMIKNEKNFCLPLEIIRLIDVGGNNTINHQIARATKKKQIECNKNKNDCSVCIDDKEKIARQDVGSAAYNLYEYINTHDKVKEKYRELFSDKYKTSTNAKGFTPLDFAKNCKPEFAEFMTREFEIPTKIPTTQVESLRSSLKDAVSKFVKRVASSKSKKETKPKSIKDEDLTIEELEAKIQKILTSEEFTNALAHFGDETWDKFIKENGESFDKIDELEKILDKKILEKETKETKKTKIPKSFLSRVRDVFRNRKEKKGGKTRRHKKTNKRRTYRRK